MQFDLPSCGLTLELPAMVPPMLVSPPLLAASVHPPHLLLQLRVGTLVGAAGLRPAPAHTGVLHCWCLSTGSHERTLMVTVSRILAHLW